jgi:integrase
LVRGLITEGNGWISEGLALRVKDIDSASDRMVIRVVQGKGGVDRYTLLRPTLLALLREHCRRYQCQGTQRHARRADAPRRAAGQGCRQDPGTPPGTGCGW